MVYKTTFLLSSFLSGVYILEHLLTHFFLASLHFGPYYRHSAPATEHIRHQTLGQESARQNGATAGPQPNAFVGHDRLVGRETGKRVDRTAGWPLARPVEAPTRQGLLCALHSVVRRSKL